MYVHGENRGDNEDTDEEGRTFPLIHQLSHKTPVWMNFGVCQGASSGRAVIGRKSVTKLCKKEHTARSSGTIDTRHIMDWKRNTVYGYGLDTVT